MADLDNNPIVKILGSESDLPYVNNAVVLLYTLAVVQQGRRSGTLVARFFSALIRAFGAIGFVLPLIMGQLPGDVFNGLDYHAKMVAYAMIIDAIPYNDFLPGFVNDGLDFCQDLAHAIVKGNAAAMGFAAIAGVSGEGFVAPLVGAYLAVNGHRLIENGVSALTARSATDADSKLALLGGLMYWSATTGFVAGITFSALVARACLVLFRVSTNYVNYDGLFDQVSEQVSGVLKGAQKRGRSASRKRRA